ncbi:MAG: xanthine/uracil permease family protein, partial [Firmicutes bacterium]|nr:xanthine/uracil permease family protein [Bacillota bacterium]
MKQAAVSNGILENIFKLSEKKTNVKTEIIAGVTTFVTLAYIIFVNPNILADAGIPKEAAIASTIWATALTTMLMSVWANFPIAVAPGMGLNAFFAYYVVGVLKL